MRRQIQEQRNLERQRAGEADRIAQIEYRRQIAEAGSKGLDEKQLSEGVERMREEREKARLEGAKMSRDRIAAENAELQKKLKMAQVKGRDDKNLSPEVLFVRRYVCVCACIYVCMYYVFV